MRDFKTDFESGKFNDFDIISEGIPYLYKDVLVSIPIDADDDLRRCIFAAIDKYEHPDIPYETIWEQLAPEVYSEDANVSDTDYIYFSISRSVDICSKIMEQFFAEQKNYKGENRGKMDIFWSALIRLRASFKSAIISMQHGYFIEVVPTLRLIFEQLSWMCYILEEDDKEKLQKKDPQNCITYLKQRFANNVYGELYGNLSSDSHLTWKSIGNYYKIEEGQVKILSRSGKFCKDDILTLIVLYRTYIDIIWAGMNDYEMSEDDYEYYNNFYQFEIKFCQALGEAEQKEAFFKKVQK